MDRLAHSSALVRRLTEPSWGLAQVEFALAENHLRYRQGVRRTRQLVCAGLVAVAALAVWAGRSGSPTPAVAPVVQEDQGPAVAARGHVFADGSKWQPANDNAVLEIRRESATAVVTTLRRGRGRLRVSKMPQRRFSVRIDTVEVQVVGTEFSVERREDARSVGFAGVWVHHGKVRVRWPGGGSALLAAGDGGWFPPVSIRRNSTASGRAGGSATVTRHDAASPTPSHPQTRRDGQRLHARHPRRRRAQRFVAVRPVVIRLTEPRAATAGQTRIAPVDGRSTEHGAAASARSEWSGDRSGLEAAVASGLPLGGMPLAGPFPPPRKGVAKPRAVREPRHSKPVAVPEFPVGASALLTAADRERLGNSPARAVPLLRRFLVLHEDDARAPLAAFTLGKLLSRLGQHAPAAAAFLRARALAPFGELFEDALAREAQAHASAGDLGQAKQRARQYLRRYPKGRLVELVRRAAQLGE